MGVCGIPIRCGVSGVAASSHQAPTTLYPTTKNSLKGAALLPRLLLSFSHKEITNMNDFALTDEQLSVIHHPIGRHARVLAVAGSGKSFTMACRIQHLVQECHVAPHAIRVLMFNRLAREQFRTHLDRTGLPDTMQPEVHTFHSFSFQVINTMVRIGVLPGLTQFWTGEKEELVWLAAKRAIESLEGQHQIPPDTIVTE